MKRLTLTMLAAGWCTAAAWAATASRVDNASLSEALDDVADWSFHGLELDGLDGLYGVMGLKETPTAKEGTSHLQLNNPGFSVPYVSRTVEGPGVAKVWATADGPWVVGPRGETPVFWARVTVVDGPSVSTLDEGQGWLEIPVPAGQHEVRLEAPVVAGNAGPYGGYLNNAFFDAFSFTPLPFQLEVADSATVGPGEPVSIQASAPAPVVFSLEGAPQGLSINADTGLITGSVSAVGWYSFTVRATRDAAEQAKTVTLRVALPYSTLLSNAIPEWSWRTAPTANEAFAVTETGFVTLGATAWLEAEAEGPGWITWEQSNTAHHYDGRPAIGTGSLAVSVDGKQIGETRIPPWISFAARKVWIPEGTHTVHWSAELPMAGAGMVGAGLGFRSEVELRHVAFVPQAGLTPPPGSVSYQQWAAALPEDKREPEQDADGDGRSNWAAYAFGTGSGNFQGDIRLESDAWTVISLPYSVDAAECDYGFEFWTPEGYSEATVYDHEFSVSDGQLRLRLTRLPRLYTGPASEWPQIDDYRVLEAAPTVVIGRFVARRKQ